MIYSNSHECRGLADRVSPRIASLIGIAMAVSATMTGCTDGRSEARPATAPVASLVGGPENAPEFDCTVTRELNRNCFKAEGD